MSSRPRRIRWARPAVASAAARSVELARADVVTPVRADRATRLRAIEAAGVPFLEGATAKELAIELLKIAAEVEHALMVQYLYATTSIPPPSDGVNYREKVLDIAIEEMGHLATVQNLLILLGGRDAIYMQRDLMRAASEKNPIPFVLEKVTRTSLAKYVAAEKPAEVPPDIAEEVRVLVEIATADAGGEPNRVGVIYELLHWMFTPADLASESDDIDFATIAPQLPANPHLGDADLQPAEVIAAHEALPEEWGVFEPHVILLPTRNAEEARVAIRRIAEQGEGLEGTDASHFIEFLETVRAFDKGEIAVRSLAKSPTLGAHGGQPGEPITNSYTRMWGEVFSLHYSLLVLTIQHALMTSRTDPATSTLRNELADLAVDNMRKVIVPLSDLLAELPIGADPAALCGPPYDLDPSILESSGPDDLVAKHLSMLDRLIVVYAEIEAAPQFAKFPGHRNRLTNLRNMDKRRRKLFET
jgi:hypothetical protein